ncbi:hypothetical protein FALBO_6868 [Fusarium albosuccineum]|uniref:Extracellular membrane protein CFEM domain-containing protein n=1 Tax=Fusarium albosuccineum TaxID=1237068 RepID=A0A8H4LDY9_9HYPO|nr:hypothetical protein FALBO_6868 [Fusarium albosuccineum]
MRMMRQRVLQRVLFCLFLVQVSVASITEEGREYCTGKGSICEAFDKLDKDCEEETGPKYEKCICESGWVPLRKAAMGDFVLDLEGSDRAACEDSDYTVAPIPSSILSQQKQHNKTAEVPTMPASVSETYSIDRSYTTLSHEAQATTLYGGAASVTLPEIAAPTEEEDKDEDNLAGRCAGVTYLATAMFAVVLTMIMT